MQSQDLITSMPMIKQQYSFVILIIMNLTKRSPLRTLKSSISPRKSSSPLKGSASSNKLKTVPTSKTLKFDQTPSNNQSASKNRQTLTQTLDTYTLLIRSKNPIRCLEHNSNISIYCETQQKLLCANCIFGRTEHKFHRVTPIDRSYDKIEKDIDTMNRLIDRQLDTMRKTGDRLMQSLVQEENDAHDCLSDLVMQYEECHKKIEESFLLSKSKIIERLEKVRRNYETLMLQLKLHMQNYSTSSLMKPINREYFKKEQFLLFEHVVCTAIVNQKKFEQSSWVTQKRQVYSLAADERKKVLTVMEMINRLMAREK